MSDTTLTDFPPGCGCSACQASAYDSSQMGTSSDDYSNDGVGDITNALSYQYSSSWGTNTIQYKFLDNMPSYYLSGDDENVGFNSFNAQMEQATLEIFDHLKTFVNLDFIETTNESQNTTLTFGRTEETGNVKGHAYYPTTHLKGGDVWIDNDGTYTGAYKVNDPVQGNYAYMVLLHEIGHALGLEHTFSNYSGSDDTNEFSVMAYNTTGYVENGSFWTIGTYGIYDIAALQSLYGANTTHASGDDVYTFGFTNWGSIWDTGGNDTIDASTATLDVTINLTPGTLSSIDSPTYYNAGIAFGVTIENATGGSGNDTLIGNDAANILRGNAGDDSFYESEGNDTFYGGTGNDLAIYAGALSEYVISIVDGASLTVQTIINGFIDAIHDIESFLFNNVAYSFTDLDTLFGGNYNDIVGYDDRKDFLRGTVGDDRISGLNGDDDIRSGDGNDRIYGGLGDDKIYGDAGDDVINGNEGKDRILGGDGVDTLYGDGGYDHLFGGNGQDTLHGGTGNDYLLGHADDDILNGDAGNDYLYGGSGNDTLNGGTERDFLYGNAGNDTLNGEDGNDILFGHAGDDIINGGNDRDKLYGSNGNDTLNGDAGNDLLYGHNDNDTLNGGEGTDNLYGGLGDDILNGDDGNDWLYGNSGNDILNGGAGDDYLYGHDGNDILFGGGGIDKLYGSTGNDTFILNLTTDANTLIGDFNRNDDVLDLSDVLSAYDSLSDDINNFLEVTKVSGKSTISVDIDGLANGQNFTTIGTVNGLGTLNAQDLEDNNLIIV